jgi:uncharacterized protein YjbI with pentapeptide repeats
MDRNAPQRPPEPGRPLSIRAIVIGAVLVGLVGAVAVGALLYFYGGGTDQDRTGLDVVRTAGTLVVGTGGAIALLLTARRQRSTELTLEHQRKVASATQRDAAEQRITELYARAVDQLGNGQAPVRLGGLYALERLAQNNPDQRQTIVDVICAYLRMPYIPPDDEAPTEKATAEEHGRYEQRRQELQVRITAQRILASHLTPYSEDVFWTGIDLNLSEAHLYRLDLTNCHVRNAQFGRAQFSGDGAFGRAQFSEDASFDGARFGADARFNGTQFSGSALFRGAQFGGDALFDGAQFDWIGLFDGAQFGADARFEAHFNGDAFFSEAQFTGIAWFIEAQFRRGTWFRDAQFGEAARFGGAHFGGDALFDGARFGGDTSFDGAQFSGDVRFDKVRLRSDLVHSWPAGWTTREARPADGEEEGAIYLVRVEDLTE